MGPSLPTLAIRQGLPDLVLPEWVNLAVLLARLFPARPALPSPELLLAVLPGLQLQRDY